MSYRYSSPVNSTAHIIALFALTATLGQGAVALHNLSDQELWISTPTTSIVPQPLIGTTPATIINGALFARNATNSGSGTFRDIVRFDGSTNNDPTGQNAYNRDTNGVLDDSFIGQENGDIRVSDMIRDSTNFYYAFRLDINNEGFTSIDEIKVWNSNIALSTTGTAPNSLPALETALGVSGNDTTLVYDLDGGVDDNTIFLNSTDTPGSGSSDLAIFIPQSAFDKANPDYHVYFYIQMNGYDEVVTGTLYDANPDDPTAGASEVDISANRGNHESVALPIIDDPANPVYIVAVPEPSGLALISLSFFALTIRRKRG